ncbi:hypothetical protein KY331_00845 [Candidatus Woesearchaeota archaeon]|nr:hypothetical protein [Candidatus Woesearchaeota archaeon]
MEKNIAVIEGDGIGPEIVAEAIKVLDTVAKIRRHTLHYRFADMGGAAYDKATAGMSEEEKEKIDGWNDEDKRKLTLPQEALDTMDWARDSRGAVLFGSVGRADLPKRTAELALLGMRKRYGVVNNRPFIIDPILAHNSILFREPVEVFGFEIISPETSLLNGTTMTSYNSSQTEKKISRKDIEALITDAFEKAKETGKQIMCATKYNVLVSEKMISDVFEEVAKRYEGQVTLNPATNWQSNPDAKLKFIQRYKYCGTTALDIIETGKVPTGQLIIDNAGMQIAKAPHNYANTIVIADAMFGDFLQAIIDVVSGSKPVNKKALDEIKEKGIKRTFIRELCGGLYFGERGVIANEHAYDTMDYDRPTIEDLASVANRVNSQLGLDTIDSLEIDGVPTFKFWATVLNDDAERKGYNVRHLNVKEGVETLLTDPASLGTVIASNMMGDIYTDLAAAVVGKSLGIMPSSAVNSDGFGIYEQIAGSAPDIAGKNEANPIAEIRSAAMMLEDFGDKEGAQMIYKAIGKAIGKARTPDIWEQGYAKVSTQEMGDLIVQYIKEAA